MGRKPLIIVLCLFVWSGCEEESLVVENPPPPPPGPAMHNFAGTGIAGVGAMDQLPLDTDLRWPQDIAFGPDTSLVVVDWGNHRVITLDKTTGHFRQITGTTDGTPGEPCAPYPVPCDIGAQDTPFNHPTHVYSRADGMMVISAWHNFGVFLVDPLSDAMSRVAGTGRLGYNGDEQTATAATISYPSASVYDQTGRLVFTDQTNMVVRAVDGAGVIHTIAGTAPVWDGTRYIPQAGFVGDEGPAISAKFRFSGPTTSGKLCIDTAGNIYIADTENHAIRMLDTAGMIHRFAGVYPAEAGFSGDGGPATSAKLRQPRDVACDGDGNVFIADTGNHVIRMVNPAGVISTVAGTPGVAGDGEDDKPATQSALNLPFGIEVDPLGNLWIADTENSRIRVVFR